jgi:hypothetical protein
MERGWQICKTSPLGLKITYFSKGKNKELMGPEMQDILRKGTQDRN